MKSSDDHLERDDWVLTRWSLQIKNMPVDSINGYSPELPVRQASTRPAAAPAASSASDSFDSTATLKSAQSQTATVRPDKVARASQLLADPSYPNDKVLNQLAGFLANRL
jgi:hypothetical protein